MAPDICPPDAATAAMGLDVLGLYMSLGQNAPPEEQIEERQTYLEDFLKKRGKATWCKLYAGAGIFLLFGFALGRLVMRWQVQRFLTELDVERREAELGA